MDRELTVAVLCLLLVVNVLGQTIGPAEEGLSSESHFGTLWFNLSDVDTVAAIPFTSLVQVPIYPLVHVPTSPPILECTNNAVGGDASPLSDSPFWHLGGLWKLQQKLKDYYDDAVAAPQPQLAYSDSLDDRSTVFGVCEAQKMALDTKLSFNEAFCLCNAPRNSSDSCASTSELVLGTQCISETAFDVRQCQARTAELENFDELSKQCRGIIGGTLYFEDMLLNNMLYPSKILPDKINITSSQIFRQEGPTYYLAWMALERFGKWADTYTHCNSRNPPSFIPGWENVMILYAAEEGVQDAPPAVVLLKRGINDFIVLFRDSRNSFEGRLYAQHELAFKYINNFTPEVREGASSMLAAASGPLDVFFDNYFQQYFNSVGMLYTTLMAHPRLITIGMGGHGASAAAAMANYLSYRWDDPRYGWATDLTVHSILFNAPRVGGESFVNSYRSKVNGRNIMSKYGSLNTLPCSYQPLCNTTQLVTGSLFSSESYAELGGAVEIDPLTDVTYYQDFGWYEPKTRLDLMGQSMCAIKCWLVRNFCVDDPVDLCSSLTCPGLFERSLPM